MSTTVLAETQRVRRGHDFYAFPPDTPRLYETETTHPELEDKVLVARYFGPGVQGWWIVEFNPDGEDAGMAFGCCRLFADGPHWSLIYLPELEEIYVPPFTIIERDLDWEPKTFREAAL